MALEPLDTVRTVATPEGATLELRLAGPFPRILAWSIDLLVRAAGYWGLAVLVSALGQTGYALMLLALFVGEWFYPVIFELVWDGATPGKRALGIAAVHDDGTRVGWRGSVLRNLLRFADFLPAMYLAGLGSMVMSRDFQRLGDWVAGTVVVYRERKPTLAAFGKSPPRAPPITLSLAEQRAVIDFADRNGLWSEARKVELASIAQPLTQSATDKPEALRAMAAWLGGSR
jgi:uncharacterized RDD family membrane protein YckC